MIKQIGILLYLTLCLTVKNFGQFNGNNTVKNKIIAIDECSKYSILSFKGKNFVKEINTNKIICKLNINETIIDAYFLNDTQVVIAYCNKADYGKISIWDLVKNKELSTHQFTEIDLPLYKNDFRGFNFYHSQLNEFMYGSYLGNRTHYFKIKKSKIVKWEEERGVYIFSPNGKYMLKHLDSNNYHLVNNYTKEVVDTLIKSKTEKDANPKFLSDSLIYLSEYIEEGDIWGVSLLEIKNNKLKRAYRLNQIHKDSFNDPIFWGQSDEFLYKDRFSDKKYIIWHSSTFYTNEGKEPISKNKLIFKEISETISDYYIFRKKYHDFDVKTERLILFNQPHETGPRQDEDSTITIKDVFGKKILYEIKHCSAKLILAAKENIKTTLANNGNFMYLKKGRFWVNHIGNAQPIYSIKFDKNKWIKLHESGKYLMVYENKDAAEGVWKPRYYDYLIEVATGKKIEFKE